MSKTPHTPAPWEFGKDRRWLFRDNLKADGVFSSSTILKIDDNAFRPTEADARLIEAAPEMLEFIREIAKRNPVFAKGDEKQHIKDAAALVARATGEAAL